MDSKHSAVISRRVTLVGLSASGLTLALTARAGSAFAQQSTPPSGPIKGTELAPGVVAEVFAGAPSARAPGQTVYLARFTFQPGAEIFAHGHPGTTVLGFPPAFSVGRSWRGRLTSYVEPGAAARRPRTSPSRVRRSFLIQAMRSSMRTT